MDCLPGQNKVAIVESSVAVSASSTVFLVQSIPLDVF